ncbi:MAG: ComF family protein [Pseudomonadota bacterium]
MNVNIRKISGPWDNGISLDKHTLHSVYTGDNEYGHPTFDTTRTEVGESLYQLKYRNDNNQVPVIANELSLAASTEFSFVSFVLPMPSSQQRARQPVVEIARQVAINMRVPCIENMLLKNAHTEQMKNISNKEEKIEALCNKLYLNDVLNDGLYDVMIVDDLYDTGATLEAATIVLRNYAKIRNIYVATITRKR